MRTGKFKKWGLFLYALLCSQKISFAQSEDSLKAQLIEAVKESNIPKIRFLKKTFPELEKIRDAQGDSLLQIACREKQFNSVIYLLDKGYTATLNEMDSEKKTPLIRAIENSDLELLKALAHSPATNFFRKKLNPNQKDGFDWSPLSLAVKLEKNDFIKYLLTLQANPNVIDPDGFTPLSRSLSRKDFEATFLLVQNRNTQLTLKDHFEKTPQDYALESKDRSLMSLVNPKNPRPSININLNSQTNKMRTQLLPEEPYYVVKIPFATNRKKSGFYESDYFYSKEVSSSLDYGEAVVTVPKSHVRGRMERPGFFDIMENPKNHIILKSINLKTQEVFMKELANNLEARSASEELRRDKDDVFLYIHGFNTPFAKALRKTAQLTLDLDFQGIPMSYSWPAQNVSVPMPWDFRTDAYAMESSLPQFNNFIKELRKNIHREKDQCLHLVAHSMGSRALARILNLISYREKELMKDPHYIKPFCEVILVAPAIDAEVFIKSNSPNLAKVSDRVTIYASSDDVALNLQWLAEDDSFTFPLGSKSSEGYLALSPHIETIDLSKVSVGPWSFNHSKYSELPQVEDDIRDILVYRLGAQERLARGAKLIKKFMKSLFLIDPQQLHFWEMAPR